MNKKHFVINEEKISLPKEDIQAIEESKSVVLKESFEKKLELTKKRKLTEQVELKHTYGRIIIQIDLEEKNSHTFESGQKIYIGRQFNNLNRRETEPVNATVIDSEYIPKGAEILIHPNAIVDANKIFSYANISVEQNNSLRYYSIEEISAYIYFENNEWKPLKGFTTALRVFKPYEGRISFISPLLFKNILYITSGEFKGLVCHTVIAADYEIIFMGKEGREERIIRVRHFDGIKHDREELTCIDYGLTEQVNNGTLKIGLSPADCKTLKEHYG